MGSNELGWVRLEVDVLLSTRTVRPLAAAERARLLTLLRSECRMLGFDDARGSKFGCRAVGIDTYRRRGVADLLRSTSLYRGLGVHTREPLLEAIPDRLPTRMDDRAPRRYLSVLRARKRAS